MNRLYAIESGYSVTGLAADHRWPMKSGKIASFLGGLIAEFERQQGGGDVGASGGDGATPEIAKRVALIAEDLRNNLGNAVILVGENQPAVVHAYAAKLNETVGSNIVSYVDDPMGDEPSSLESIETLVGEMKGGKVRTLLIIGGNPVYDAPASLGFADALGSVTTTAHLSLYGNETSWKCGWHLNQSHPFESWGDAIAHDGTWCVSQPLIEPLFNSKSAIELIAELMGEEEKVGRNIVQMSAAGKSSHSWRKIVHDGFAQGSGKKLDDLKLVEISEALPNDWDGTLPNTGFDKADVELVFRPGYGTYDGRMANNGWLQETPSH